MQRITISLPDPLAAMLQREAQRRRQTVSAFVRGAVTIALEQHEHSVTRLPFAGIGRSEHEHTARNAEDVLATAWLQEDDQASPGDST